ncbi:unnamed protein product [Diamesa hyperborea]
MITSSPMVSVVREDKSVAIIPKAVVLGYLAHCNKKPDLKEHWPLAEYHLSIPKTIQPGSFKHDVDCSCLFCDSYAKEKEKNDILSSSYNIFFNTFKPKNVPSSILEKYGNFYAKRPDVSLEYFLIYYHDTTDFTISSKSNTLDLKNMKNMKNYLVKDEKPSIEQRFISIYVPLARRQLLESDESQEDVDAYYSIPPWLRQRNNIETDDIQSHS